MLTEKSQYEPSDVDADEEAAVAYNPDENRRLSEVHTPTKTIAREMGLRIQRSMGKDGNIRTLMRAKKTDWIQNLIWLDGKKFSFEGRPYLTQIYNGKYPKRLLKFSRQAEKSTMLANEIIINSAVNPYYKSLLVTPSHSQTRQLSNGKLKPWIEGSPIIKKYLQNSQVSQQVFEKSFTNGSIVFLRSSFLNADRCRGVTSNMLCLDEIQSMLMANIPVIEECTSHVEDPLEILSGTPLTLENPIEQYWQMSSQNIWLVPCYAHAPKHWNFMDERCMGKQGPICNKCGKPINPADGQWVSLSGKHDIEGFHVSQVMVPWIYRTPSKWKELIWKLENYSRGQFYNECLGISYDNSTKPVTRMDLMSCCSPQYHFLYHPTKWSNQMDLFAGVDWGEGSDGSERNQRGRLKNASYTVLSIGCYIDPQRFHYLYYRRFEGHEASPEFVLREIIKTLRIFRVKCVGADWGHGWGMNERLETALGPRRVIKFQHVGGQKERKKYDPVGHKYQLSRNEVISDFIMDIKDKKIVWPEYSLVSKFLIDIENIYQEYSEYTRTVRYDHLPSNPDDALHSSIYCREAADVYFGRSR